MLAEDDDYDPLAPVLYESEREDEASGDVDDEFVPAADFGSGEPEADLDSEEPEPDGGFSDPENVARVWLEEGRVVRVRISTRWAAKLKGRSLSEPVNMAFMIAAAQSLLTDATSSGHEDKLERHEVDLTGVELPPFSAASFGAVAQIINQIEGRIDQAFADRESNDFLPPPPDPVVGRAKGVEVRLDEDGMVQRVDFDEDWLDDAQAGTISKNILAAARQAQERFVPREPQQDDELDGLMEERDFYLAVLKTMLNPKE